MVSCGVSQHVPDVQLGVFAVVWKNMLNIRFKLVFASIEGVAVTRSVGRNPTDLEGIADQAC